MSEFTTRKITDRAGTGAPSFTYGLNIAGSDSGLIGKAITSSGTEPSSPANGDLWYDSTNDKLYYYVNSEFKQITHANASSFWGGDRGFLMGGYQSSGFTDQIQYWDMATASNASDFGDMTSARAENQGLSDGSRGISGKGYITGYTRTNIIEYITTATLGNATDFGDVLSAAAQNGRNGACDGTYGLFCGQDTSGYTNVIEILTVQTTGNTTDHGDLTLARIYAPMANDASRWLALGGYGAGGVNQTNIIDYGTFTATGATDFGDLITIGYNAGACSDETRALKAGGYTNSLQNAIEYVTIQTTGNATDFGDLIQANQGIAGMSNNTNGQFAGTWTYATNIHTVVIQTTGNASDHGDLATGVASPAGFSGAAS